MYQNLLKEYFVYKPPKYTNRMHWHNCIERNKGYSIFKGYSVVGEGGDWKIIGNVGVVGNN